MTVTAEPSFSKPIAIGHVFRYLEQIRSARHALMISAVLASCFGLFSQMGTQLVYSLLLQGDPSGFVLFASYGFPFLSVFACSFLLIRSFVILNLRSEALSEAAERDELTRLSNRAGFFRKGRIMMDQSRHIGFPLSLILIDTDHFKKVNDTYGHLAGDKALQHLARLLMQASRQNDLVARWGGEEFAILLRSSGLRGAQAYADRLRRKVANAPMPWKGEEISLSFSAGVTQWYEDDDNFESMMLRADKALYRAKSAGRNQVQIARLYPEEVEGYEQDVHFEDDDDQLDDVIYHDAVA